MKRILWDAKREFVYLDLGTESRRYTLDEAKIIQKTLRTLLDDIAAAPQSGHSREIDFTPKTTHHVYVEVGDKEYQLLNRLVYGMINSSVLQDDGFMRSMQKLEALGYIIYYPVSDDIIGSIDVAITPEGRRFLESK